MSGLIAYMVIGKFNNSTKDEGMLLFFDAPITAS
jgi:hypothetical protein